MDARQELLTYLASAITTVVVLFGLQYWYESYLDVDVVHAEDPTAPLDAKVVAVRGKEHETLESGHVPIEKAMQELAERGRQAFPIIAPKPSEDLSAMSGWIRMPGFAPYTPHLAPAAEAGPAPAAPAEGEQPAEGAESGSAEPAQGGEPAAGSATAADTNTAPEGADSAAQAAPAADEAAKEKAGRPARPDLSRDRRSVRAQDATQPR